jgi:hypothetical protein
MDSFHVLRSFKIGQSNPPRPYTLEAEPSINLPIAGRPTRVVKFGNEKGPSSLRPFIGDPLDRFFPLRIAQKGRKNRHGGEEL